MRINAIETIRVRERPNLIWVVIETNEGVTGLGETFFLASTLETYIHDHAAPILLGRDPLAIGAIGEALTGYLGHRAPGVETRGISAIDIALWDLWGRATGQPIAQLLGGHARRSVRTYNTCAGPEYIKSDAGQNTGNFGIGTHPLDDLDAFLHRADELAEDLLGEGITAMKIWPFDAAAERSGGLDIPPDEMRTALEPFEKIRRAVGDRMEVMVEFHSLWQLPPAMRIARALAPYGTYWHEDPIRMDSLASLKRYAAVSEAPVCASETLASRWAFRDLLETDAAGIVMLDISWCGGLSEARTIAEMARTWHLPVAPHDCVGPVTLAASIQLSLHAPNAVFQESVRAALRTWYPDLIRDVPRVVDGHIHPIPGAGHGCALLPDLEKGHEVIRRRTNAND